MDLDEILEQVRRAFSSELVVGEPVGAWVIRGGDVRWQPAVDATRVLAAVCALLALVAWRVTRPG